MFKLSKESKITFFCLLVIPLIWIAVNHYGWINGWKVKSVDLRLASNLPGARGEISHIMDSTEEVVVDGNKTIPIYRNVSVEQPTDAVLSVKSQKGFPGCHDRYKLLLNEVREYDTNNSFMGIRQQSDVNHIQILNCWQTDEALRRVYEGRGVPVFFKLREK